MRKFTPTEIDLCKKIAEKERKEIGLGDYYTEPKTQKGVALWDYEDSPYFVGDQCSDTVPLWQEYDCLEWLKPHCKAHIILSHDVIDSIEWFVWIDEYKETQVMGSGETPLEALLRAVLAVMEE